MAVVIGERMLVLVFVTSLLVWSSGGGGYDEEAPGIISHVEENVEKTEVPVESKTEEETEQLPTTISEPTENSNPEEIGEGAGEEPVSVKEEHDVVTTHHPGVLEPSLPTPPGDETTPTNIEVTPTDLEMEAEFEQPIEIASPATEATPTGEGGEEREGGGEAGKGGEEGDDVPTFTEFSQRKRMEQNSTQRLANEKPTLTNGGQHNYASIDCGAKIIAANEETQNPSAILSENRDHYMINPCSADIWFVVELCELVELHSLQIACFELFSSIPENFNISVSERYPVDEWRFLGMLHASNEREVQTFLLSPDESSYAKFLRVDMVSHYGSEHFCPLSLLRVNGSSMMEVYEYSESQQEGSVESLSPTVAPYEGGREEDDLFGGILEENVSQQLEAGIQGAGLKELLAGAVRILIETVGDYMRPAEDKESHTPPQIVTPEYLTPESDVESESVSTAATSSHSSSDEGSIAEEKVAFADDVIITTPTETDETSKDVPEDYPSLEGLLKHSMPKTHSIPLSETIEPILETTPPINEAPPTPTPTSRSTSSQDNGNEQTEQVIGSVVASGTPMADNGGTLVHDGGDKMVQDPDNSGQEWPDSVADNGTMVGNNGSVVTETGTVVDDPEEHDQESVNQTSTEGERQYHNSTLVSGEENEGEEEEKESDGINDETEVVADMDDVDATSKPVVGGRLENGASGEEGGEVGEGVMGEKSAEGGELSDRETLQETLTNGNGAGGLSGQPKEKSVFLRLSNRIRDLEENMSLFSSYLDEISTGMKRNKNRTEDGHRSLERRLSLLNDSLQLTTNQTELALVVLVYLHGNIEDIRKAVENISEDMTQGMTKLVWLVCSLIFILTSLLAVSIATIVWLLCNKTTTSQRDSRLTQTKAKETEKDVCVPSAQPLANGICTMAHIGNGSGLLGATENQQTLELHSDESLHSEPWSRVARKRKTKPKNL